MTSLLYLPLRKFPFPFNTKTTNWLSKLRYVSQTSNGHRSLGLFTHDKQTARGHLTAFMPPPRGSMPLRPQKAFLLDNQNELLHIHTPCNSEALFHHGLYFIFRSCHHVPFRPPEFAAVSEILNAVYCIIAVCPKKGKFGVLAILSMV